MVPNLRASAEAGSAVRSVTSNGFPPGPFQFVTGAVATIASAPGARAVSRALARTLSRGAGATTLARAVSVRGADVARSLGCGRSRSRHAALDNASPSETIAA
jgi:hypothetical protein